MSRIVQTALPSAGRWDLTPRFVLALGTNADCSPALSCSGACMCAACGTAIAKSAVPRSLQTVAGHPRELANLGQPRQHRDFRRSDEDSERRAVCAVVAAVQGFRRPPNSDRRCTRGGRQCAEPLSVILQVVGSFAELTNEDALTRPLAGRCTTDHRCGFTAFLSVCRPLLGFPR